MQPAFNKSPGDRADEILKEYEDFVYIVSHDLSAPLRHIKEFTSLLVGARKEMLTEEEQKYVRFLEKSLQRIDGIQRALLTFSRLNTQAGPFQETNFNEAVADALKDLGDVIDMSAPDFKCGTLPVLLAEQKQIRLLFYHLIGNALKFHKPHASVRQVSISAADDGDFWLFEVRDNGIGIDKKYYKDIFRLFRRLEPELYPGTGAGLTIVQRIIERHGGEISVKSTPGSGTAICFSLLKNR